MITIMWLYSLYYNLNVENYILLLNTVLSCMGNIIFFWLFTHLL